MKVKELISALQQQDPELDVMIFDSEYDRYFYVEGPETIVVLKNYYRDHKGDTCFEYVPNNDFNARGSTEEVFIVNLA